jgi:hypothetical protein
VPTESGEITAASASVMESQALDIERRLVGADERLSGVVRLATSELFAGYLLASDSRLPSRGFRLEAFNTSKLVQPPSEKTLRQLPRDISCGRIVRPTLIEERLRECVISPRIDIHFRTHSRCICRLGEG